MKYPFYIETPVHFDSNSGLAEGVEALERRYSDMKNMYLDEKARETLENSGNAVIYRFYDMGVPEEKGDLAFGSSIVYPGKVGDE